MVLLEHKTNQGVGGAIATGYKWCRDHEMDVAVVMAGDAQMNPDDLSALLEPVVKDDVDYAKGNRLITGNAWKLIPKVRYLGNSAMSLLTKIASGYWHVADSQSGYTAINSRALETIDWGQMYKRYGQPNDLLVRLNVHNFRVCDVPVTPVYNIGEVSGFNPLWMIPKLSCLLCKLFFYRMWQKYVIRDFHPLGFIYLLHDGDRTIFLPFLDWQSFEWVLFGFSASLCGLRRRSGFGYQCAVRLGFFVACHGYPACKRSFLPPAIREEVRYTFPRMESRLP